MGPVGEGVAGNLPAGGTTGQITQKLSPADFDAGWVTPTKATVGLANVDNTSDANKPISTATQTALNAKMPLGNVFHLEGPWYKAIEAGSGFTAALQAASTDAYNAGGGIVQGNFSVEKVLTAEVRYYNNVVYRDLRLKVNTDLGAGKAAFKPDPSCVPDYSAAQFQNVRLYGPGARSLGVQTSNMDGIRTYGYVSMIQCDIRNFRAGAQILSNHEYFVHCKFSDNFYGVLWDDGALTYGNQQFYSCQLDGNTWAAIACTGANKIDACLFMGGHMGFSPYGFYRFNGPSGPSSVSWISQTVMDQFAFEYIGNCAIRDATTGAGQGANSLFAVDIRWPGFSWSTADYRLPGQPHDYAVHVRNVAHLKIFAPINAFSDGAIATYNMQAHASSGITCVIDSGDYLPRFVASTCAGVQIENSRRWSGYVAEVAGDVTLGDGVQYSQNAAIRRYGIEARAFGGVAMQSSVVGQSCIVANKGLVQANCRVIDVGGRYLMTDPTARHIMKPVVTGAIAQVDPVVAIAHKDGGAAGGALNYVRLIDPFFANGT
jgi:hypothetical protein